MLKEIAKYLNDSGLGFTIGTTLSVGRFESESPDTCTAIIDDMGGEANFFLPDKKTQKIRFYSRAENINTARVNIYKVFDFFQGNAQITLPVVTAGEKYIVNTAHAPSAPFYIYTDEKDLHLYELVVEFDIKNFDT